MLGEIMIEVEVLEGVLEPIQVASLQLPLEKHYIFLREQVQPDMVLQVETLGFPEIMTVPMPWSVRREGIL